MLQLAVAIYVLWLAGSIFFKSILRLIGPFGTYSEDEARASAAKKALRYGIIVLIGLVAAFLLLSFSAIGYGIYSHFHSNH